MSYIAVVVISGGLVSGILGFFASMRQVHRPLEGYGSSGGGRAESFSSKAVFGWRLASMFTAEPNQDTQDELWIVEKDYGVLMYERALGTAGMALASLLLSLGVGFGFFVTCSLAAVMSVAGYFWPQLALRSAVADRRNELSTSLAFFVELFASSVAGGSSATTAASEAARAGTGWSWDLFRRATVQANSTSEELSTLLTDLGRRSKVFELVDLGNAMDITINEGGILKHTLINQAELINDSVNRRATEHAEKNSNRLVLASSTVFVSFIVFILFAVLSSLNAALLG